MKTTFLRQTTEDKLILQGLLHEPDTPTKNIILHIHGMSGNFYENRFLDPMAATFVKNNWAFLAPNTRGHDQIADIPVEGNSEEFKRIGNTFEKFDECVLDIKCWLDFAQKQGFTNIVLQGHSLGCSKIVFYLYKTQDLRVKKLILASHADMVGFGERWKHHKEMMTLAQSLVKEGRGEEILPKKFENWSYLSAQTFLDFHTRDNPIDVFNTYDRNSPSEALSAISIPTLAFLGSGKDSYLTKTPQESLEIVKSKANNCPKFTTAVIKDAPHSYFGHEQEVADLIADWLKLN